MPKNDQPNRREPPRPRNCGECARFIPLADGSTPRCGTCSEWGIVYEHYICHPNIGRKNVEGEA